MRERAPGRRRGRRSSVAGPAAGAPEVAGRQRDRVRVRALQHRGPRGHGQQVAAVEDAAADVPARVEVGDQPTALGPRRTAVAVSKAVGWASSVCGTHRQGARVASHGLHAPRPQRPVGLPPLPRHHELRLEDRGGRLARDHGPRARPRASTSSTPPTSTASTPARAAPRRSSAPGSPRAASGARRPCWPPRSTAHVRLAQRHLPVRPQHRPRLRGLAAPDADRLDRPLPVPPRRPAHAVGRDLAGLRDARRPGQGALRRLLQPRRLADRRRERGGRPPALPGPGQRAVALQPAHPARRARGAPGRPALRRRHHPVEPAGRRPAGRRAGEDRGRTAQRGAQPEAGREAPPRARGSTRRSAARSAHAPADVGAGLAAAPAGGHRADRRAAHDGAVRGRAARRSSVRAGRRPRWPGSTRSSRATRPRPWSTPGEQARHAGSRPVTRRARLDVS